MRILRQALKTRSAQAAFGWVIAGVIRLLAATGRWEVRGGAIPEGLRAAGVPVIGAVWHGRMLMLPIAWRGGGVDALVSGHSDGRLIGAALGRFGVGTLTGSSRRGGTAALRAMLRSLARGRAVVLTPDGPRGPRQRVGGAIVDLARLSGAAIVPASYGASRRWVAPSWDRFMVPLPFARGIVVFGEPIAVARDADPAACEAARLLLESRLDDLGAEADRLVGRAARRSARTQPA